MIPPLQNHESLNEREERLKRKALVASKKKAQATFAKNRKKRSPKRKDDNSGNKKAMGTNGAPDSLGRVLCPNESGI